MSSPRAVYGSRIFRFGLPIAMSAYFQISATCGHRPRFHFGAGLLCVALLFSTCGVRAQVTAGKPAGVTSSPAVARPLVPTLSIPPSTEESSAALPVVLSGGSDHSLKHWDAAGKLNGLMGMHETAVSVIALTYAPGMNGKPMPLLISGSSDGMLKWWDMAEEETANAMALRSVKAHEGGVTALAASPDTLIIATGGADAAIRLWSRANGRLLAEVKAHDDSVRSLQFSGDGKMLVSSSDDRQIRIWKLGAQGRMLDYESTIVAHEGSITAISLSPAGDLIASVSMDGYAKIWATNGSLMRRIKVTSKGVLVVAFSPDGKSIATGDEEGKIRVWNVKTGAGLAFAGSHDRGVTALAWTANGEMLVSGGGDKTLRYWNTRTGHQIARIAAHDGTVQTLVVVP